MASGINLSTVHAVVLAGGEGSRMSPLVSSEQPKAMLAIANRPMLFYTLFSLVHSNITHITVVVDPESKPKISHYVHNDLPNDPSFAAFKDATYTIEVKERNADAETADALRELDIKQQYTLILSSDTIIDLSFQSFLDFHHSKQAVCSVALTQVQPTPPQKSSKSSKSSSDKSSFTPQLYTICNRDDRLLSFLHPTDLESSKATIPSILIRRYKSLKLQSDLLDSHVYCFCTPALNHVLKYCPAISSVKYDLIPYVSRRQHTLWRIADHQSWPTPADDFSVYNLTLPSSTYALRTNTISSFRTANLDIAAGKIPSWLKSDTADSKQSQPAQKKKEKKPRPPIPFDPAGERVSVSPDSLVGKSCSAGDRTSVKKTVIGNNCRLGSNVKLNGCVIMDNVEIKDGANLTSCIVCDDANVGASCVLKDCRVAASASVDDETEATDRSFGGENENKAVSFADGLGDDIEFF